jgi:hypothetical protein
VLAAFLRFGGFLQAATFVGDALLGCRLSIAGIRAIRGADTDLDLID